MQVDIFRREASPMACRAHKLPDYRESGGLEITMERRGNTLRIRAYLNRHGFVAFACRQDYPADTVTEGEILDDVAKELSVDAANLISEKPGPHPGRCVDP
jgi:hypothetical protein